MLLWAVAGGFLCLALRELYSGIVARRGFERPQPISWGYVAGTLLIGGAVAWFPMRMWMFEGFLTEKARLLSGSATATVHCNTVFDTMLDPMSLAAGHADPVTGRIVLQKPWCGVLMRHLRHPERMDPKGVFAVQMFAHECMHIRGEMNEAVTECQALQRHVRAARLLGMQPDALARRSGTLFYESIYQQRAGIGGMQAAYHSDECAPGAALDEHLQDSTWRR